MSSVNNIPDDLARRSGDHLRTELREYRLGKKRGFAMSMNGGAWSRRSFLAGLSGVTLASPARAQSPMWDGGPPVLRTMHSQFTELRPLNEVPALTLERTDHKMIALNAFRGRVVLLNFWATWCAPGRELPLLDDHRRATARQSLEIVAVSIDQAGRTAVEHF